MDRTFWIIIVGAVFITPLVYLETTLDPTLAVRLLIASVLTTLVIFSIWPELRKGDDESHRSLLRRWPVLALGALVIISALSIFRALNLAEGLADLTKLVMWAAFVFGTAVVLRGDERRLCLLARCVTVSGLLLAIVGIAQYYNLGFNFIPGNGLPYGTMANRNLFGSILFLCLPFTCMTIVRRHPTWRPLALFSATVQYHALIIAHSRAVWVATAVFVLVAGVAAWSVRHKLGWPKERSSRNRHLSPRILFIPIMLLVIGFVSAKLADLNPDAEPVASRALSMANLESESTQERFDLWERSLKMASDNLWLGVGIGNWKIAFPSYGLEGMRAEQGQVFFQRPHNDFLWVLAECGMFGLLCYLAIFVSVLWYAMRVLGRAKSRSDILLALFALAGIVGFLVIGSLSYPRERIAHLVYVGLLLAAVLSVYHYRFSIKVPVARWIVDPVIGLVVISLLAGTVVSWYRVGSEMAVRGIWKAQAEGNTTRMIHFSDEAESLVYTVDALSTPIAWYRGTAYFEKGDIERARTNFEQAMKYHPYHINVLNNFGSSYEMIGDHSMAIYYYRRALKFAPNYTEVLFNLAAAYFNSGRYDDAKKTLLRMPIDLADPRLDIYLEEVRNKLNR